VRRYAFLDRDGTLVPEYPDAAWRGRTELLLLPGTGAALRRLASAGYALVVVTNQYLIDEGLVTDDEYRRQTRSLTSALAVEGVELLDVLHCRHARTVECGCRKPATGMVEEAVRRHGALDRDGSFVAGDSPADMGLADAVGVRGFMVGPQPTSSVPKGTVWVGDLATLVARVGA